MAGRTDIQAGAAFVRLYVKNNELIKGLSAAGSKLKEWGGSIAWIGGAISGLGAAILTPLAAMAEKFAASGDEINKMAQRTGASTEALSQLRYAAGQSGIALGDIETGMKHMAKAIDGARNGSREAVETMQRLGVGMEDLQAPPDKQLEIFADRLEAVQDPGERAALALKVFGKSGTSLLPLMADGAAGIRALRQEAEDLGLTIDDDTAQAATNLGDAWDRVKAAFSGIVLTIGGALAPALESILGAVKDGVVFVSKWVRENKQLVLVIAQIGIGLVIAGGVITAFGGAIVAAGAVLGGLATILTTVGMAIGGLVGLLASGPGLLVGAIVGGVAAFALLTDTGRAWLASITQAFADIWATATTTWQGIKDAIASGDLALAGQIAFGGLKLAWLEFANVFKTIWEDAKLYFMLAWEEATAFFSTIGTTAFSGLQTAWVVATAFIADIWERMVVGMANSFRRLQQGVGNAIIAAAEKSGAVSKEFADAWRQSLNEPIDTEVAGRTAARDNRLAEIEKNKQEQLAGIGASTQAAIAERERQKRANEQGAFDANRSAIDQQKAEIEKARADLAAMAATAGAGRATKEMGGLAGKIGMGIAESLTADIAAPGAAQLAAKSQGTFSAAAAAALGGPGGVQERIAKNTAEQKKLAEKQTALQNSMAFAMSTIAGGLRHA